MATLVPCSIDIQLASTQAPNITQHCQASDLWPLTSCMLKLGSAHNTSGGFHTCNTIIKSKMCVCVFIQVCRSKFKRAKGSVQLLGELRFLTMQRRCCIAEKVLWRSRSQAYVAGNGTSAHIASRRSCMSDLAQQEAGVGRCVPIEGQGRQRLSLVRLCSLHHVQPQTMPGLMMEWTVCVSISHVQSGCTTRECIRSTPPATYPPSTSVTICAERYPK